MQNNMKSQKICCWKCNKISSHDIDIAGKPTLILTCPVCQASLIINFAPFQRQETFVYRKFAPSSYMQSQMPGIKIYDLPEILDSSEPKS